MTVHHFEPLTADTTLAALRNKKTAAKKKPISANVISYGNASKANRNWFRHKFHYLLLRPEEINSVWTSLVSLGLDEMEWNVCCIFNYVHQMLFSHKNIVSKLANDYWPTWPSRWRKWIGHLHWFLFKFKSNFTLHTFRSNFSLIKCEQRSTAPNLLCASFDARGNHLLPIGIIHFNYLTLFNNTNCYIILIVELMAWH